MIANRQCLIAFLSIACLVCATNSGAAASRIYRTVDEQGNVVFTDVPPREGEESAQIVIEAPNSFDAREATPQTDAWIVEPTDDAAAPAFSYETLSIVSPPNDEAVRENAGNVSIVADVNPGLQYGHVMRLLMDGAVVQEGRQTTFALANVDRGTHVIGLEIIDEQGQVVARSDDSTFHLLRHHIKPKPRPRPQPSPTR
ncbi:MAG TPA: DUF4124 domain-containing protein [Pseudomonadales bacterium]